MDFCPVIWAFCRIFSRERFRDFCPAIWAFCGFFFRKHFRDCCPVIWGFCSFFSGNISGTSVPLSGHLAGFFQETFQGLLSRYLGILPEFFPGNLSGTSVPLSGQSRDFFSGNLQGLLPHYLGILRVFVRKHFRDCCPVIWAFCGNFFQGTFQGLLSRYLASLGIFFQGTFRDFCPIIWAFWIFFQGTFQELLSRYLGILPKMAAPKMNCGHSAKDGNPKMKIFRDCGPIFWAHTARISGRLAKTAEQLSNFWKLLKIDNWFKFSIVQKVLCCSFHFVPIRFKNWFWFPRNVPGTSVSFSDRILPNMAPEKKLFKKMLREICFLTCPVFGVPSIFVSAHVMGQQSLKDFLRKKHFVGCHFWP